MIVDPIDPVHNLEFTTEGPGIQGMADSFGEPLLPPSTALEGRTVTLRYRSGQVIAHEFGPDAGIRWTILEGSGAGAEGLVRGWVMEARPGIFFVDFEEADIREDMSIVLDFETGRSTTAISKLVEADGDVRSQTEFQKPADELS